MAKAKSCLSIFFRFLKALWTNLCRTSSMPVSSYILECLVILALKKERTHINIKNPGVDIKQWTNCRVGMLGWALLSLNFAIVSNQVGEL